MSIVTTIKQNKIKSVLITLIFLIFLTMIFMYTNKVAPVSWGWFGETYTNNGLALNGGDTVAYFTKNKYIPGDASIATTKYGATWHFSSENNKQLFIESPEKYMPQYGGFCAFAVSKNVTATASPDFWVIHNNKLYIFNAESVKLEWLDGIEAGSLITSDKNWATRI